MRIAFEGVGFAYPTAAATAAPVLRDATFAIEPGEVLALVGPTGSGKTTLLRLIAGLEKPQSGRILADDHAVEGLRPAQVGYLFQQAERQLFCPTVIEDVSFGPKNLGLTRADAENVAAQSLQLVGLEPEAFAGRSPFELSGGEARRVALAGVLATKPALLLLDEPTIGLDPASHRQFIDLIARLNRDQGITVCMATHDMDDVARTCTQVGILDGSGTLAIDTPAHAFENADRMRALGLDVSFAARVALDLSGRGFTFDPLPITIDALADALAARTVRAR